MLFAKLNELSILPELHPSLLLYVTSLFLAGDLPMWLSHGFKFLLSLWNPPPDPSAFEQSSLSFALKLHLCLSDTGWAGWKLIGLPLVFRSTVRPDLRLVDNHREEFLAALKRGRKLGPSADVDPVLLSEVTYSHATRRHRQQMRCGESADSFCVLIRYSRFSD